MAISKDDVVTFHYRLSNAEGQELESSYGGDPMAYLHGHQNIISGLENAMTEHSAGDVFTVTVAAAEAYGPRQEGATQRVPIKHLVGDKKSLARLRPGDIATMNTEQGPRQVIVVKPGKFNIDVDTNHPLAGKDLTFDIEIQEVREATSEEIAHGHAHGVGGHHH